MRRSIVMSVSILVASIAACAPERRDGVPNGEGEPVVEEGRLEVEGGFGLYYRLVGDGEQKVIIPAGFFLEDALAALAERRALVFYDMRDRGRSDSVPDMTQVGIQQDIDDLEAIRAHFGLERISLIGWSYLGAMVAMYALQHPERVERLVQIGPIPPRANPPYVQAAMQAYMEALSPAGLERLEELTAAGVEEAEPERFYREFWRVHKVALFGDTTKMSLYEMPPAELSNEWLHNLGAHFAAKIASFGDYDLRAAASGLDLPVLIVHGTRDRNAPFDGGREWATAWANARLLVVNGAAHMPFVEQPDLVMPAIDEFLSGRWPEASEATREGR